MPEIWNIIIPVLATLAGAGVGAWGTYLATYQIETLRSEQQKQDRLSEDRRAALKSVMDWLDPMIRAKRVVETLGLRALIGGPIDDNRAPVLDQWPDFASELGKMLPHPSVRFIVGGQHHGNALEVIWQFDEIRQFSESLRCEWKAYKMDAELARSASTQPNSTLEAHKDKIGGLQAELWVSLLELDYLLDQFKDKLSEAYLATYK